MTFNLTRLRVLSLYNIHILLALMTYFIPYTSFANCHVSSHADIQVDKMYLTDGQETLADLLSPADIHRVTEAMSKVTCDKSPIYVNIAGESTSFFKFNDDQFTYDSIEDSIGTGALVNKLSISILAKGQAPGAQALDLYISDDKDAKKWSPGVADVLQLRAEYIITDWTPPFVLLRHHQLLRYQVLHRGNRLWRRLLSILSVIKHLIPLWLELLLLRTSLQKQLMALFMIKII